MQLNTTLPRRRFPEGYVIDPARQAAGKYGTLEQEGTWGQEQTFEFSLTAQGQAALTLSRLRPDIVPEEHAAEIAERANLTYVKPDVIRELEAKGGHDVIAINGALERALSVEARAHVNKARTSADTTQTAKAMQMKRSLESIAESVENLRDIMIEKMMLWREKPHMDNTHQYDALPTVAGRPFAHYVEMLQSGLNVMKFFYDNSLIGKWGDATGNHHSADALGIDGIALQERYCTDLGLGWMDAAAQVPGLEFEADVTYSMARLGETLNNVSKFIAWGRSDDVNIFSYTSPSRKKGSSAMPHKDAKNGNPDAEEQVTSLRNYLQGNMMTSLSNCELPYARALYGSANTRINAEDGAKFMDHATRNLANVAYWLALNEERAMARVLRSYGVVTSQRVMTYLTDQRVTSDPMARSEAHDLTAALATQAWTTQTQFVDVVLANPEVTRRLDASTIREITDPLRYIGQSRAIIERVAEKCYQRKTIR